MQLPRWDSEAKPFGKNFTPLSHGLSSSVVNINTFQKDVKRGESSHADAEFARDQKRWCKNVATMTEHEGGIKDATRTIDPEDGLKVTANFK